MQAFIVDAFTQEIYKGNKAGVVLNTENYSSKQKQEIAHEIGASETAFIKKGNSSDYQIDFFTPSCPIDFCGHATLASAYMLSHLGHIGKNDKITIETKAGIIPIEMKELDGQIYVSMEPRKSQFAPFNSGIEILADALNINVNDMDQAFPVSLANAGNWHLMLAMKSKDTLDSIVYDSAKLTSLLNQHNAVTIHVFYQENNQKFHARNFGPNIGIAEDPATGAAAGAFAAYLAQHGFLADGENCLEIVQGEAMGRRSEIFVSVKMTGSQIDHLKISGTARLSFTLGL